MTNMQRSTRPEYSDTVEAIEECYRLGWSDGLPVVPPVEYKVRDMLELSGLTGEEEILSMDMRRRVLTSENAAANAVMAGCLPEYFPVLTTALRALDEEKNYVNMAASSTSSPAVLIIVNGPIRHQLELNSKDGLVRPRQPGQRLHRAGGATLLYERVRGPARHPRPRHPGQSQQVQPVLRRRRGGFPVGAASRLARLQRRGQLRDRGGRLQPHHRE